MGTGTPGWTLGAGSATGLIQPHPPHLVWSCSAPTCPQDNRKGGAGGVAGQLEGGPEQRPPVIWMGGAREQSGVGGRIGTAVRHDPPALTTGSGVIAPTSRRVSSGRRSLGIWLSWHGGRSWLPQPFLCPVPLPLASPDLAGVGVWGPLLRDDGCPPLTVGGPEVTGHCRVCHPLRLSQGSWAVDVNKGRCLRSRCCVKTRRKACVALLCGRPRRPPACHLPHLVFPEGRELEGGCGVASCGRVLGQGGCVPACISLCPCFTWIFTSEVLGSFESNAV